MSHDLENAKKLLEEEKFPAAQALAEQVISAEKDNSEAWMIKGMAIGFQSEPGKSRMEEMVECWLEGLRLCPEDQLDTLHSKIGTDFCKVFWAYAARLGDQFKENPIAENKDAILAQFRAAQDHMNTLMIRGGVTLWIGVCFNMASHFIVSRVSGAMVKLLDSYEVMAKVVPSLAWEMFEPRATACFQLLAHIRLYILDPALVATCLSVEIDIRSIFISSPQFSDFLKIAHRLSLNQYEVVAEQYKVGPAKAAHFILHEHDEEENAKRAYQDYWNRHAAEKQALQKERDELAVRIKDLNAKQKKLPYAKAIESIRYKIRQLETEREGLWFFQKKQKQILQVQIDQLMEQKREQENQEQEEQSALTRQLKEAKSRKSAINKELKKPRGSMPLPDEPGALTMDRVVEGGSFLFTPRDLADHFHKILTRKEEVTLGQGVSPLPDYGNQYLVNTSETQSRTRLFCAADAEDAPVKQLLLTFCPWDRDPAGVKDELIPNVVFGIKVLCSLIPSITQAKAEEVMLNMWYSKDDTVFVQDDILCQLAFVQAVPSAGTESGDPITNGVIVIRPLHQKV